MGAPCCSKPQAVCFRSLAELTIENPPTSSTLIFVCGGPLEPPSVSSSLSESEPDAALARFRDGPPLVLPRGGGGCGATAIFFFVFFVFFFAFFWVALLDDGGSVLTVGIEEEVEGGGGGGKSDG